ncbi:MAG: ABC transporter permease [Candidatus Aminicenantes bacterium]|jgi:putative ABC transport system permease protein
MFFNYLKVAIRTIKRYKGYSLINMAGLAIGMTVAGLIFFWVLDELSFDSFNANEDQIHRVCVDLEAGTHMVLPLSMPELGEAVREAFPEVQNFARISRPDRAFIKHEDAEFHENLVCYADNSLFEVFTFLFTQGNPQNALLNPYSAVITQDTAKKYFGNEDPIGQNLKINGTSDYIVTGVVEEIPVNSHFRFHVALSFETLYTENLQDMENWLNIQYYTYLLLAEDTDPDILEDKLSRIVDTHLGDTLRSMGGSLVLFLQPLSQIHLHSKIGGDIAAQGDITYVYLFSAIAVFVLVLACINFINLATARSATRALEIGIRKTLGSSKKSILLQFLGESMLYSIISLLFAIAAIQTIQPWFETLIGRPLSGASLQIPGFLWGSVGVAVIVGILAGSYPAVYLSGFRPTHVLKSGLPTGISRSIFRNSLVVFQFSVSILLIIGTITVYRQIHFMKTKDLGYDEDHIIVIPGAHHLLQRMSFASLREEIMTLTGVIDVGGSAPVPTKGIQYGIFYPQGFTESQPQKLTRMDIEPGYITTMGIDIIEGRNFSSDLLTDDEESLLINETVAKHLGWTNPLGKTITFYPGRGGRGGLATRRVIGIVKDFHTSSLHDKIEPLVIVYNYDRIQYLSVRVTPGNISQTISLLKRKWEVLDQQRPFDYFFLDTSLDRQYTSEERVGNLSLYFSLLSIFIGCLGLFGLTAYIAERRTKEIGIRKVLGASAARIVRLLSGEFLLLVLLANVLAWPIAYFGLRLWLRNFSYRINITWPIMIIAACLAVVIAIPTVSFQSIKAALCNPVDSLRYE